MKKQTGIIFVTIALIFLLSACRVQTAKKKTSSTESTKQSSTTESKMNIETDASMLEGNWVSEGEEEIYYIVIKSVTDTSIEYSDNLEEKNSQILEIDSISNDAISTLTQDKKTFYRFIFLEDDKITSFSGVNTDFYKNKKTEEIPVGLSKPITYRKMLESE